MFFPRLTTLLPFVLLSTAISSFAAPAPTQDLIIKRQDDGIVSALQTLKDATGAILVSCNDLVAAGTLDNVTGAEQANNLIAALTTGGNSIKALGGVAAKRELAVRQADLGGLNTVVANLLAEIIKDVVNIVKILQGLPLLGGLLTGSQCFCFSRDFLSCSRRN